MIRLREISGNERLVQHFVAQYAMQGGFPLPLEYARRCRAYAFIDGDDPATMVGGFLLNATGPFRSLENMPEADRQRVLAQIDLDQTFEGMCFWVSRQMWGGLRTVWFWVSVLVVLWRFPKRNILSCTVSRALYRMYGALHPTLLYEGSIRLPDRTLPKLVFLVPGKQRFVRAVATEAARRVRRRIERAVPHLRPQRALRPGVAAH